ncbi:MAG: D-sedoheptulose 7-phosphate isomerase [Chloroflexia bacterium]|nr:D-sedoheptulose 7-phosphate isomerase [Chloroflexia bacterium]
MHRDHDLGKALESRLELIGRMAETTAVIVEIAAAIVGSLERGGKLLLFGNGGSAADAQHVAAEFVNRFLIEREAFPAIALTTDSSILTSIGNDRSFDQLFSRQLAALARPEDIVVGISTSGNSPNVLQALSYARDRGIKTVGFTGEGGGRLVELVDICFQSPSDATPLIQEAHIMAWHMICQLVERRLAA